MKRYRFLLLFVVAFVTLASNVLPWNASAASSLLATATRTPTKKPVATKRPSFSPSTARRTPPKDINSVIQEVLYFGLGGGGDEEDPCKNITRPTIMSEWFDVEQLHNAWVYSCGWRVSRKVSVKLTKPDGASQTDTVDVFGWKPSSTFGEAYWYYLPTAFDPLGTYRVSFSNGEQSLGFEFNVSRISTSGAVLLRDAQEVQIYNFRPNENVRLFRFRYDYDPSNYNPDTDQLTLLDWQEFAAGSDGKLRIQLVPSIMEDSFAVVGERSGEFHLESYAAAVGFGQSILKVNTPVLSDTPLCRGAPKSRVAVGSAARVTFTDGTPTRIRLQPTTSAKIIGRIPEGTRFLIVGGNECGDGYTWWNIELGNGTRGWMAEGKGGSYYLEPMDYRQQTCSEMGTRLKLGIRARVAFVNGSNMRIRSQPGFSQGIVDRVPEGTLLTVLDGPKCIDGNYWWFIRTSSGIQGWMTESQNGTYLLEPAQ
jgi:hypothetical protein